MLIYFCFLFSFNFLTVNHKKFTPSDFHQEVAFNQYFYLHREFMFLCTFLSICLSVCFWRLPYFRTNEQIFIKKDRTLWVGPCQRKKLLIFGKDLDHILDTKNHEFS